MDIEIVNLSIVCGERDKISAVLSVPRSYRAEEGTGIILAHGAGNDMNHPLIATMAEGLAAAGYLALRFNFPYREKGQKAPDKQEVLVGTWERVYHFLGDHPLYRPKEIVAAGKSMGGRVASQMVADGLLPAAGLVFLGYPLHPPGKKEKLRDAHFQRITIPMLFFAGSRDSLCDLTLFREVLGRLPGPWQLEVVEGGDHSFRLPKSAGLTQEEVYQRILQKSLTWMAPVGSRQ